jgi:hypothetical protein
VKPDKHTEDILRYLVREKEGNVAKQIINDDIRLLFCLFFIIYILLLRCKNSFPQRVSAKRKLGKISLFFLSASFRNIWSKLRPPGKSGCTSTRSSSFLVVTILVTSVTLLQFCSEGLISPNASEVSVNKYM